MWRGLFVFYFCEEVSQMVQIDSVDLVVAFIAAMGVPSAILGLIVWRLKVRVEAREAVQEKKNADQQQLFLLIVQSTRASIALGEATAHALQRGHTNGDMEAALKYAADIKHKQKDFFAEQGIHALLDE